MLRFMQRLIILLKLCSVFWNQIRQKRPKVQLPKSTTRQRRPGTTWLAPHQTISYYQQKTDCQLEDRIFLGSLISWCIWVFVTWIPYITVYGIFYGWPLLNVLKSTLSHSTVWIYSLCCRLMLISMLVVASKSKSQVMNRTNILLSGLIRFWSWKLGYGYHYFEVYHIFYDRVYDIYYMIYALIYQLLFEHWHISFNFEFYFFHHQRENFKKWVIKHGQQ